MRRERATVFNVHPLIALGHVLLAAATLLTLGACQSLNGGVDSTTGPNTPNTASFVTQPRMPGRLQAETLGYTDAKGAKPLCSLPAQAVDVLRFEAGRYAVAARCEGMRFAAQLWVDAAVLDYEDAALAPDLHRVLPSANVQISMAYAGDRIFCDATGKCLVNEALYGKPRCYAAPPAVEALKRAAALLSQQDSGLRLNLLDCYRPVYVQQRMFALVSNPTWVAEPKPPRYGGHNRGVAIDLTLSRNGVDLDMGTPFDSFDELSGWTADGKGISAVQQANRNTLRQLMLAAGFRPYDAEWWHFSVPVNTPPLNLPL